MKPEMTSTGLDVQTYEEIFEELSDGYKSIYGTDIVIDADSPDGQRIGIESTAILDIQAFAAYLYNSIDPDVASGDFLNKIIKFCGIYRRPASQSQWDLEVTVTEDITLSADYTVKDNIGQEWVIASSTAVTVAGSPNTVSFLASDYGAISGLDTYTIEQVTYEPSVLLIEPDGDAVVGIDEETDEELRIRRNKSLLLPSYTTIGGLLSSLLNIPGVTDCVVYENKTSVYDATNDLNPHSQWVVIEGGEVADIAEKVAKHRTGGVDLKGSESTTYNEDVVRPDGIVVTIGHEVNYDRPTYTDIYINLTVTRKTATSPAIDANEIKAALAEAEFLIGEPVLASELYEYAYNGGTSFAAYDLEISDDDVTYTDEVLPITPGVKYRIDTANITVTEV